MKKALLFLFTILVMLGCSSDDDKTTNCWVFETKQTTSISPSMPGYPKYVTSKTTQCDLTEEQAKEVVSKLTTTVKEKSNGYTITVSTTVKYWKEGNDPDIPQGEIVVNPID